MSAEKFDDLIGVKCFSDTRKALTRIARARGLEGAADLLRFAATAIIEYATLYGDTEVPKDMAISQRRAPANELALSAESKPKAARQPYDPGAGFRGTVTDVVAATVAQGAADDHSGQSKRNAPTTESAIEKPAPGSSKRSPGGKR